MRGISKCPRTPPSPTANGWNFRRRQRDSNARPSLASDFGLLRGIDPSSAPGRLSDVLHVHRAERADGLVEALRSLLAASVPDPFAAEVVAVPTRGMERWLAQRMSDRLGAEDERGDGICANVDFPSPRRLVGDAVATASGIEADADPWLPERAVWALLEVVDGCLGEPWLASLAAHLGGSGDDVDPARRARRFSAVRHLAELFDRYALHRPEMVRAWARGEDGSVPADGVWQAELWRRLRARIGVPDPAERVEGACARLREEPGIVDLPARLSLFGLTRLPAGHLNVLRALAVGRDVHVFMLHPSPALWERVAERGVWSPGGGRIRLRRCRRIGCSLLGGRTRGRCSWFSGRATTSTIITP